MWAPHHPAYAVMSAAFDMVIEPGEFAYDEDQGVTAAMRDGVITVPPLLLVDDRLKLFHWELAASGARRGSREDKTVAVIRLGSERNFDFTGLKRRVVGELLARDIQVVEVLNPLARSPDESNSNGDASHCDLSARRVFRHNRPDDNERELQQLPRVHLRRRPDYLRSQRSSRHLDDQYVRAAYARSAGLGLCLRSSQLTRVADTIDVALSAEFRAEHRRRTKQLEFQNGAADAAAAIEELIFSVRTDRPLNATVARV